MKKLQNKQEFRETLRSYESGKTAPDLKVLPKILKVYKADINDAKIEDDK